MKLKKVLSLLTACCTAVTTMSAGLCLSSSAAANPTFAVENVTAAAGDTVELNVTIDSISGHDGEGKRRHS